MQWIARPRAALVLILLTTAYVLIGCATKMSEEDKFLWNGGETNAPAVPKP
jgi:hypothetical protein